MKQLKFFFALSMAILMLGILHVPALAFVPMQGETALSPPPPGVVAHIPYSCADLGSDFIVSAPSKGGFSATGNMLILNGSELVAADWAAFQLYDSTKAARQWITVSEREFYDFDDATVGMDIDGNAKRLKVDGTRGTDYFLSFAGNSIVQEEANGNKFADGSCVAIVSEWANAKMKAGTFSALVRPAASANLLALHSTKNGIDKDYYARIGVDANNKLVSYYNADGSNATSAPVPIGDITIPSTKWTEVRMEFDVIAKQYKVYVDDVCVTQTPYTMNTANAGTALGLVTVKSDCDDVALYTGKKYVEPKPYQLTAGNETIYLPAQNKAAKVQYALVSADGLATPIENANYSISPSSGARVDSNGYVWVSSSTPAGNYTLSATAGDSTYVATKNIKVAAEKWWYDFESGTVSTTSSENDVPEPGQMNYTNTATWDVTSDNETNNFLSLSRRNDQSADATTGLKPASKYRPIHHLDEYFNGPTTIEFDTKFTEWSYLANLKNATGGLIGSIYSPNATQINSDYNAAGEPAVTGSKWANFSNWRHIRIEILKDTYTLYIDDEVRYNGFKSVNSGFLGSLHVPGNIDNLSIYTGSADRLTASAGASRLAVPATGNNTYDLSANYFDGSVVNGVTYSFVGDYSGGATINGNVLTVPFDVDLMPITIAATDGVASDTLTLHLDKNYITVSDSAYTEGMIAADGSTIKAGYGASDMVGEWGLFIARYKDGQLVKLSQDKGQIGNITNLEVVTDALAAGETVKVLVWDWSTLQPVREGTTIPVQ